MIKTNNIIGVFDLDNTTKSKFTKDYLSTIQKKNRVINVTNELPKSFVICMENGEEIVYISQLSPSTLLKRLNSLKKRKL